MACDDILYLMFHVKHLKNKKQSKTQKHLTQVVWSVSFVKKIISFKKNNKKRNLQN